MDSDVQVPWTNSGRIAALGGPGTTGGVPARRNATIDDLIAMRRGFLDRLQGVPRFLRAVHQLRQAGLTQLAQLGPLGSGRVLAQPLE